MSEALPPLTWDAGEPPVARRVEPLGEGDFTTCHLIDGALVLRIARHAEASASIGREIALLPRLVGRVGVEVPRVVGHGRRADTGARFIAYPLVPGTSLTRSVLAGLDPPRRTALVRAMADFARALHRLPLEVGAGLPRVDPREALLRAMEAGRARLAPRLAPAVWSWHERLLERYLAEPDLRAHEPAVLHGDLSPGHFLADLERGVLTGVIDFGDAFVGDPHRDLIFILEDYGPEILDAFLETYAPEDDLAAERVRIHQRFDNVAYALAKLEEENEAGIEASLRTLAAQARAG